VPTGPQRYHDGGTHRGRPLRRACQLRTSRRHQLRAVRRVPLRVPRSLRKASGLQGIFLLARPWSLRRWTWSTMVHDACSCSRRRAQTVASPPALRVRRARRFLGDCCAAGPRPARTVAFGHPGAIPCLAYFVQVFCQTRAGPVWITLAGVVSRAELAGGIARPRRLRGHLPDLEPGG
jgi:hypothetical protein